ncbi:hypothetical protein N7501_009039 [Penicillium viridicatum]|nr:hypothetical protein N7501_009039 [Penicillium viridicatum]
MRHATRTNGLGLLEPEGDGQMVKLSNGNLQDTSRHSSTPASFGPFWNPIVFFFPIICIQPAGSQENILLLQAGIVSPKGHPKSPVLRVPW